MEDGVLQYDEERRSRERVEFRSLPHDYGHRVRGISQAGASRLEARVLARNLRRHARTGTTARSTLTFALQTVELDSRHPCTTISIPLLLLLGLQSIQALAVAQIKQFYLVRVDEPGGPMVVRSRQEPRAVFERQSASGLPSWSAKPSFFNWGANTNCFWGKSCSWPGCKMLHPPERDLAKNAQVTMDRLSFGASGSAQPDASANCPAQ